MKAPYAIDAADLAYVGEQSLLGLFDVTKSMKAGGKLVLKLPGVKDDDVESKLPVELRKAISFRKVQLYILDPLAIESIANDPASETYLVQAAFLRVALPTLEKTGLQKLSSVNVSFEILERLAQTLEKALRLIEFPETWSVAVTDEASTALPSDIYPTSFTALEYR